MDTTANKQPSLSEPRNGIYVRGVVISNRANAFRRKDGSGMLVKVTHEIALQPGVALWERYFNACTDSEVEVDALGKVVRFPALPEFQPVSLRVERFKAEGDKFVMNQAAII